MILISQWYDPDAPERAAELTSARITNQSLGVFEHCHYVDGRTRRWTYGDLIGVADREYPGEVCVIANTDIAFDATARLIPAMLRPKMVLAMARWEANGSLNMLGHCCQVNDSGSQSWLFSGTQDSWAFTAGTLPELSSDTAMGVPGCDQVFLAKLVSAGCWVISPSIDIRTRHFHRNLNRYSDQPRACGEYVYPKLTTACDLSGYVMKHLCACSICCEVETELEMEFIKTCPQ
jgi:hypothetical protein